METRIRELQIDDLPAVYALGERLFSADRLPILYRTWDENDLASLFASDRETCLVVEGDGGILGFVLGSVLEKRRGAWTYGYVEWIGVEPGAARHGVGRRLLRALTDRFIELGVRMIIVDTQADNRSAIEFFKSLGFGQEHMHVYMSLNLTGHPEYQRRRRAQAEQEGEDGHGGS
jgi:ribosomal protein S18 acetylase RimI-like enzyme